MAAYPRPVATVHLFLAWKRGKQPQKKIRKIKTKIIVCETKIKTVSVAYL